MTRRLEMNFNTHTCTGIRLVVCPLLPLFVLGCIPYQLLEALGTVAKVDGVTIETTPFGEEKFYETVFIQL